MTIGVAGNRVTFNCDGATTLFPVPLQAYFAADFTVMLTAPVSAGGAESTLVLNSAYTMVTNSTDAPPKWALTTTGVSPYASGYTLTVFANPQQVQQSQYVQGQAFPSLTVQTNMDRLTQMVQRLQDQVNRSIRAPDGDVSPAMLLPPAGQRASMNLTTDANGNIALSLALASGTLSLPSILSFLGADPIQRQTAAELQAGVTPVNLQFAPGNVFRYGAVGDGITDDSVAINQATSCNTVVYFPTPTAFYGISHVLYIQSSAPVNVQWVGQSRTTTMIQPLVANLADSVTAINTMIFNRLANGKWSMSNMRLCCQGVATYNGVYIYAVSGGGADGSGQILQSGSIDNCWFDTSSPVIAGFFQGGMSNHRVSHCTFDLTWKNWIFNLQGPGGGGEIIFDNNVMFNCYDYFITHSDSTQANIVTVSGLHVYGHNRGQVFNFSNINASIKISDLVVQPQANGVSPYTNAGNVGIGTFINCTDLQLSDFQLVANPTVGTGPAATALTFSGTTAQISDGLLDGPSVGVVVKDSTSNRLSFDHVDIINTQTAAYQNASGTPTGLVTVSDCNWSDGQNNLVVFTSAAAYDFYLSNCRLMNAGLGGTSSSNNFAPATSGLCKVSDSIIGQNNGSASASNYINGAGSGQLVFQDPVFVGAPPTAIQAAAATQVGSIGRLVVPWSASVTFSAAVFDKFEITATNNTAFTVNAPTSPMDGKSISITIRNTAGVGLGAITWNAVFKMSTWTSPATAFSRTVSFFFDGTNWVQTTMSTVDVPN